MAYLGCSWEGYFNLLSRSQNYPMAAAIAEWYRYRIVACFVTSSSPVPLKTRRVGQRCTLNLTRAETSFRWCGRRARRGLLAMDLVILNLIQLTRVIPELVPSPNYHTTPYQPEVIELLQIKHASAPSTGRVFSGTRTRTCDL
ncbi:uncharacterized protein TNCV_2213811 [Trichonephila clavipes]|nr:uncharacterized protein TNCV_2213811 [Trichonephila clavipes]